MIEFENIRYDLCCFHHSTLAFTPLRSVFTSRYFYGSTLIMNSAIVFCAVLMTVFATVSSFPLMRELALLEASDNDLDYFPMFTQYGNGYNTGYNYGYNSYNTGNNGYDGYYNTNSYYQSDPINNYVQPQNAYDFYNYNMYY